jgi:hypothetical protein
MGLRAADHVTRPGVPAVPSGAPAAYPVAAPPPMIQAAMPAVHAATTNGSVVWDADELAELFTPAAPPADEGPDLPEAGIGQDDLDNLFGGSL